MKRILYFAFGSNLLSERLFRRVGFCRYINNYILEGYSLEFNCSGFANIVPNLGEQVEGALYELSPEQLKYLNEYEGFYAAQFFDSPLYPDCIIVAYIGLERVIQQSRHVLPERNYISIILEGMIEKHIEINYIKTLNTPVRPIFKQFKKTKSKRR